MISPIIVRAVTYFPGDPPPYRVGVTHVTSYQVQPPIMPPKRTQSSQKYIEQEGRVLLAIETIKKQEITVIAEAARRFNIPRTILRD